MGCQTLCCKTVAICTQLALCSSHYQRLAYLQCMQTPVWVPGKVVASKHRICSTCLALATCLFPNTDRHSSVRHANPFKLYIGAQPPEQTPVWMPGMVLQRKEHLPQLFWLVCRSTHTPLQQLWPSAHVVPHDPQLQRMTVALSAR